MWRRADPDFPLPAEAKALRRRSPVLLRWGFSAPDVQAPPAASFATTGSGAAAPWPTLTWTPTATAGPPPARSPRSTPFGTCAGSGPTERQMRRSKTNCARRCSPYVASPSSRGIRFPGASPLSYPTSFGFGSPVEVVSKMSPDASSLGRRSRSRMAASLCAGDRCMYRCVVVRS